MNHALLNVQRALTLVAQRATINVEELIKPINLADNWLSDFAALIVQQLAQSSIANPSKEAQEQALKHLNKQYLGNDGLAANNKEKTQQLMKFFYLLMSDQLQLSQFQFSKELVTDFAIKIDEGMVNCIEGFQNRLFELLKALLRPQDFSERIVCYREDLVRKAACQYSNDVHKQNVVFIIAEKVYGVELCNKYDPYSTTRSNTATVNNLLQEVFGKHFTPMQIIVALEAQIRHELTLCGYNGACDGYSQGDYESMLEYLNAILAQQQEFNFWFIIDEDTYAIRDVNWPQIRQAIIHKLHAEQFFTGHEISEGHIAQFCPIDLALYWNQLPEHAVTESINSFSSRKLTKPQCIELQHYLKPELIEIAQNAFKTYQFKIDIKTHADFYTLLKASTLDECISICAQLKNKVTLIRHVDDAAHICANLDSKRCAVVFRAFSDELNNRAEPLIFQVQNGNRRSIDKLLPLYPYLKEHLSLSNQLLLDAALLHYPLVAHQYRFIDPYSLGRELNTPLYLTNSYNFFTPYQNVRAAATQLATPIILPIIHLYANFLLLANICTNVLLLPLVIIYAPVIIIGALFNEKMAELFHIGANYLMAFAIDSAQLILFTATINAQLLIHLPLMLASVFTRSISTVFSLCAELCSNDHDVLEDDALHMPQA